MSKNTFLRTFLVNTFNRPSIYIFKYYDKEDTSKIFSRLHYISTKFNCYDRSSISYDEFPKFGKDGKYMLEPPELDKIINGIFESNFMKEHKRTDNPTYEIYYFEVDNSKYDMTIIDAKHYTPEYQESVSNTISLDLNVLKETAKSFIKYEKYIKFEL